MKESRLFGIIYHLLDKGQVPASKLAEKFEVSIRTIYRDIDSLSGAGIPIYAEVGRNGGIRLMDGFVLDKAILSEEEKQEIFAALEGLNADQRIHNRDTLSKLSAIFNIPSENWLEVDFSRWGDDGEDNDKFAMLKSAIIHHKKIKITYAASDEMIYERIICPLRLFYKAKAWYVKAYCMQKQDFRLFKLSRIVDYTLTNEGFSRVGFPEQPASSQKEYPTIVLRFPKTMAYRVYDEFNRKQIQRQKDGDLIVSVEMPEDAWLISFLLSFGTQVDILSPVYLKEVIAEQAKSIYEKNKP